MRQGSGCFVLLVTTLTFATLAAAQSPPADYPWTNDLRPVVRCQPRTLMPACKAAGGVIIKEVPELEPLDPSRRLEFGEHYDPQAYAECMKGRPLHDYTCEKKRLRRIELPVHFPYPDVPLPKLPPAVADGGYKPGMTSREYFDLLCRNEAGRFIFKRVEGVEGIFQMRPRLMATDRELRDRYVMPAPYGYSTGEADKIGPAFFLEGRDHYAFFETTLYEAERYATSKKYYHPTLFDEPPSDARYIRNSGHDDISRLDDVVKTFVTELRSQYGYFWRDIRRTMDRELGIGGGEIVVVELKTNKVLAIWRGFLLAGNEKRVWWLGGVPCPRRRLDTADTVDFLLEVLQPIAQP